MPHVELQGPGSMWEVELCAGELLPLGCSERKWSWVLHCLVPPWRGTSQHGSGVAL